LIVYGHRDIVAASEAANASDTFAAGKPAGVINR
jgi:hypothetical protein